MKTLIELKKHNKKRFIRTYHNTPTLDDWEERRDFVIKDAESKGFTTNIDKEGNLEIGNNQGFLRKPRAHKVTEGVVTFRSKDYTFTKDDGTTGYGSAIKKDQLTPTGFKVETFGNSYITYDLIK